MKKRILAGILAAILIAAVFSACAKSSEYQFDEAPSASYTTGSGEANNSGDYDSGVLNEDNILGSMAAMNGQSADLAEKIIYSARAEIETLKFDNTVADVYNLLADYGAFIENSSVTGIDYATSYYNRNTYRTANFTLRVPQESYSKLTAALSQLGNVTLLESAADNITSKFVDTESRLKAYRAEEERLLTLIEKALNIADIITIEERLSKVRYEIESLTSTLRMWQSMVDYSTVTLRIYEVKELTEEVVATKSYGQEIVDALKSTLKYMKYFFKWLLKFIVGAMPVLVVLAIIMVIVILIGRFRKKKALRKSRKNISAESPDDGNNWGE